MIASINENVVQLYGTIYSGDGQYVAYQLNKVFTEHSNVVVHLHTAGGSVFDGNLIYTTIKNAKANVQVNIDGLAASMGSIIMLAGTKITMSQNAFIMVHAPSGNVSGTQVDMTSAAKLLQSLEKLFITQYSKRTGKSTDDIKSWMIGDNWFSAEEALEAGLIDEITDPVMEEELDAEAFKQMDLVALQTKFDVKEKATTLPQTPQIKTANMKKQVISALSLATVDEQSSDTAVVQAIQDRLTAETNKATASDQRIADLERQLSEHNDKAISNIVTTAQKAGKISANATDKYVNIGKTAGIETLQSILDDMTEKPANIKNQINGNGNHTMTTETWDDLKTKKGALEKLKAEDFDTFCALYKDKFGTDFKS